VGFDPAVKVEAVVVEERPSALFEVVLATQQKVLAHVVGTVKRNFVRLVPGDRVEVELSSHDPTRGRITRKISEPRPKGSGSQGFTT
jgi:translation initiation factor IF-1